LNELLSVVMVICVIVYWVAGIRLDVCSVELAVAVVELRAADATVDPSHVGYLVHRQVDYCCDRVIKRTALLMNAVAVVQVYSAFPSLG